MDVRGPLPLTERILASLPGRAWIWVVAWTLFVMARPFAAATVLLAFGRSDEARHLLEAHVVHNVVLGSVVLLALFGIRLLATGAHRSWPALERFAQPDGNRATERGVVGLHSVVWPLGLAVLIVVASKGSPMIPSPPIANVIDTVFMVGIAVPVASWLWTYGAILVAVDRLGRRPLLPEAFPSDRGLGLLPIGRVAFNGFWVFAAAALVYFVGVPRDPIGYALGLGVILFALLACILSLWRLHQRMLVVKAGYLAQARRLYLEAYEPIRSEPSLTTLKCQAALLAAAEAMEKRAEGILEWPIEQRIVAEIVVVVTGVGTVIIARLILSHFGL